MVGKPIRNEKGIVYLSEKNQTRIKKCKRNRRFKFFKNKNRILNWFSNFLNSFLKN